LKKKKRLYTGGRESPPQKTRGRRGDPARIRSTPRLERKRYRSPVERNMQDWVDLSWKRKKIREKSEIGRENMRREKGFPGFKEIIEALKKRPQENCSNIKKWEKIVKEGDRKRYLQRRHRGGISSR